MDQLPQFQPRRALLILDLQNDFVASHGGLPVRSPADYVHHIAKLVPAFRQTGHVVWVRTEFEAARTVNDAEGVGESVITDKELPASAGLRSDLVDLSVDGHDLHFDSSTSPPSRPPISPPQAAGGRPESNANGVPRSAADEKPDELFLARSSDGGPRCCSPGTLGADFAAAVTSLIEESTDSIIVKSHYSAFNSTDLIALLRGSLVTELFICGVISNLSVYATTLDAVRHGYSVTLLGDCLGYRSVARHAEALRQMEDYMGAEVMTSVQLLEQLGYAGGMQLQQGVPNKTVERSSDPPETDQERGSATEKADEWTILSTDSAISLSESKSNDASVPPAAEENIDAPLKTQDGPADELDNTTPGKVHAAKPSEPSDGRSSLTDEVNPVNGKLPRSSTTDVLHEVSATLADMPLGPAVRSPKPTSAISRTSPGVVETATTRVVRPVEKHRVHRTHVRGPSVSTLGPGHVVGEGDSRIIHNLLSPPFRDDVFAKLKKEVHFQTMSHRGGEVPRLVAVQGQVSKDGSFPVYRHPADESPFLSAFSPTVQKIRDEVQKMLPHPVNHVLIQYYRDGQDYISEHSDKTLDVVRDSSIANVSIGAQRAMTLRTKKSASDRTVPVMDEKLRADVSSEQPATSPARTSQRVLLPHNSMFVLGQASNMRWLHGIRQDKRLITEKSPEEISYNGERISLTFRHIGTFVQPSSNRIWGQGAKSKRKDMAGTVVDGGTPEAERMVAAFGRENQESEFDWEAVYGKGFDALNITPTLPKLYLTGNPLSNLRVQLHLAESGVRYECQEADVTEQHSDSFFGRPRFIDNDLEKSEVIGALPIIFYVETYYRYNGAFGLTHPRSEVAAALTQFSESQDLLRNWLRFCQLTTIGKESSPSSSHADRLDVEKALHRELQRWEESLERFTYTAGKSYTIADSAFWPLLGEIISKWADWDREAFPELSKYHKRVSERSSVRQLMKTDGGGAGGEAHDKGSGDDDDDDDRTAKVDNTTI